VESTEDDLLKRYGGNSAKKDPQLKKFKPAPVQEPTKNYNLKDDPFYDHHAEILKAKQELENQDENHEISIDEQQDEEGGVVRESNGMKF